MKACLFTSVNVRDESYAERTHDEPRRVIDLDHCRGTRSVPSSGDVVKVSDIDDIGDYNSARRVG